MESTALQALDLASLAVGGGLTAGSLALGRFFVQLLKKRKGAGQGRFDALEVSITQTQHLNDERLRKLDQTTQALEKDLGQFTAWAEQVSAELQSQRGLIQTQQLAGPAPTPQDLQADMLVMQQMAQAQAIEAQQTPFQQEFERRKSRAAASSEAQLQPTGDPWSQQ